MHLGDTPDLSQGIADAVPASAGEPDERGHPPTPLSVMLSPSDVQEVEVETGIVAALDEDLAAPGRQASAAR